MGEFVIILLVSSFVIEFVLYCIKYSIYFRNGIPVYRKYIQCIYKPEFEDFFRTKVNFSIFYKYNRDINFIKMSDSEITFCEQNLASGESFQIIPSYAPVMRALIRFDFKENRISITGYLNWYVISVLFTLFISAIFGITIIETIIPLNLLIIFVLIFSLILKFQ